MRAVISALPSRRFAVGGDVGGARALLERRLDGALDGARRRRARRSSGRASAPPTGSWRRDWRRPGRRCRAPSRGSARRATRRRRPRWPTGSMPMLPVSMAASSREDVAEQVLGGDHVELARVADRAAWRSCRPACGAARRRGGARPRARHRAPQPRRSRARWPCRPSAARSRRPRGHREGVVDQALDLGLAVEHRVVGGVGGALALAEVDAAGELAHDHDVDAGDHLGLERAVVRQRGEALHRPQVGEQLRGPCACPAGPARGAACAGSVVSHWGPPTAPSSTASHWPAALDEAGLHGRAVGVDGDSRRACPPRRSMAKPKRSPAAASTRLRAADDLGPDAVAGQEHHGVAVRALGGAPALLATRASSSRAFT